MAMTLRDEQPSFKVVAGRSNAPAVPGGYPDLLTVGHLCELTGLSAQTVRRRMKDGTFPGVRVGRRWFVSRDALMAKFGAM